jgi:hypothetical protein
MSDTQQSIYAHGGSQIYPSMSPSREPLMHLMSKASGALLDATFGDATSRECWAAEIHALRDYILPDEPPPNWSQSDMAFAEWNLKMEVYKDRQRLRDLLTAEADVALWRDLPIRLDKGTTQRGNGNGGTTTPKPPIQP